MLSYSKCQYIVSKEVTMIIVTNLNSTTYKKKEDSDCIAPPTCLGYIRMSKECKIILTILWRTQKYLTYETVSLRVLDSHIITYLLIQCNYWSFNKYEIVKWWNLVLYLQISYTRRVQNATSMYCCISESRTKSYSSDWSTWAMLRFQYWVCWSSTIRVCTSNMQASTICSFIYMRNWLLLYHDCDWA